MNWQQAKSEMDVGKRICRDAWFNNYVFMVLLKGQSFPAEKFMNNHLRYHAKEKGGSLLVSDTFLRVTVKNIVEYYTPTDEDLSATDYYVCLGDKELSDLSIFKNRHKGRTGFVVATGYSLLDVDTERMCRSGVVFACNAATVSLPRYDYFMLCDGHMPYMQYYDKALRLADNVCYCDYTLLNHYLQAECHGNKYLLERRTADRDNYNFREDNGRLVYGSSIPHVATHLAYICGCDPIILVGTDCDYGPRGKKYAISRSRLKKKKEWPFAYAWPEPPMQEGVDMQLRTALYYWEMLQKQNPDINIFNASKGVIECFKRVDIKDYYKKQK